MCVIDEGMGGDVATDSSVIRLAILLGEIENLGERPAIQKVLELGSTVLGIGRGIRRLPVLLVVGLPLAFEILLPTAPGPELGFFQVNSLGAGVQSPFHTHGQILPVVLAGRDIRYLAVSAVQD